MSALHPPAPLPLFTHTSSPTPISVAETQLSQFLHQTTIDPSLRPDSVLSSRGDGPQSHSGGMSGSSNVNLTLWHLERVLKGLRGEDLGGLGRAKDLLLGKIEEADDGGERRQQKKRRRIEEDGKWKGKGGVPRLLVGGDDDGEEQARRDGTTADEWQDREEFEREQDVVEGEVGDRDAATVTEVPEEVRIGKDDEMDVDGDGGDGDGGVRGMLDEAAAEAVEEMNQPTKKAKTAKEKAERKSQKKERKKVEKKAREASRKG